MAKTKLFLYIPFAIITGFIVYCWTVIISTNISPTWRHWVGLVLFLLLISFYFKGFNLALIGTGAYLFLATMNVLAITTVIRTGWVRVGPVETPHVQLLSFGIFILFAVLNYDTLVDMYLDYRETKQAKTKK